MNGAEGWQFDKFDAVWRLGTPDSGAAVEWNDSDDSGWTAGAYHDHRVVHLGRFADRQEAMEAARRQLEMMRRGEG